MSRKKSIGKTKHGEGLCIGFYSFSLGVFKENFAMIHRHNLEADLGLHSYTLKINQFADMVRHSMPSHIDYLTLTILDPRRIRSKGVRWSENAFAKTQRTAI